MKISTFSDNWLETKQKSSFIDHYARKRVHQFLSSLRCGHIILQESIDGHDRIYEFGSPKDDLRAKLIITKLAFYRMVLFHGSIGAGEAYMSHCWSSPDLANTIRVISRNLAQLNKMDQGSTRLLRYYQKFQHWLSDNSLSGSKKNIHAHYDIGNPLFETFLDERMMYSSAVFDEQSQSLDLAAENKLRLIAQKLDLNSSHHVVEIGTGWGGLSVYLAKNYGCKVTTTTISEEQHKHATALVEAQGLGDLVTVLDQDYRLLKGQYDRLVSVEMIEAVGHQHFDQFFECCSNLLKDRGVMVIQAITIPEQRYNAASKNVDFIQRYIFPGGCLPSVEAMLTAVRRKTTFQIRGLDDIGISYATTLEHWRSRFMDRLDDVKQLGFDDVFVRLWEFYFCYCEGAFRERAISTVQVTFEKVD